LLILIDSDYLWEFASMEDAYVPGVSAGSGILLASACVTPGVLANPCVIPDDLYQLLGQVFVFVGWVGLTQHVFAGCFPGQWSCCS
jgi:hypothetical protein